MISATHVRLLHAGVQVTLLDLRSRFWILKGRRTVKKVLQSCLACRRLRLLPVSVPVAPLPKDRIMEASPFDVVGVDFCGPLYYRSTQQSAKLYIAVFSCAVTRAVHLELTSDMTARSFILAFRRFTSRRGIPSTVYSDNASQDIPQLFRTTAIAAQRKRPRPRKCPPNQVEVHRRTSSVVGWFLGARHQDN